MTAGHHGLTASVMARLDARAKALGVETNVMLTRFANERLLYRLSVSPHAKRFLLKGATLMTVWLGDAARPTRDADLAGFGDLSEATLRSIFESVCAIDVHDDGMQFDAQSIRIDLIRQEDEYGGRRVRLVGRIGRSRIPLQVDIGIGDAVSPPPVWVELPAILDFPRARVRAYRPETSIAEKFHVIVSLGTANSRMKDYFDIASLAEQLPFKSKVLREAIRSTFRHRHTELPLEVPPALTDDFAALAQKQTQWRAFVKRTDSHAEADFQQIVLSVRDFLMPVVNEGFLGSWPAGGPWRTTSG